MVHCANLCRKLADSGAYEIASGYVRDMEQVEREQFTRPQAEFYVSAIAGCNLGCNCCFPRLTQFWIREMSVLASFGNNHLYSRS